jgi:hypothetical protein
MLGRGKNQWVIRTSMQPSRRCLSCRRQAVLPSVLEFFAVAVRMDDSSSCEEAYGCPSRVRFMLHWHLRSLQGILRKA